MRAFVTLALVASLGVLPACELGDGGGTTGPGTGGGGEDMTVNLQSTGALDGWVRSDGNLATTGLPITGDIDGVAAGLGYRQFFSFDLSSLPAGSTVTAATLRVYQLSTTGTPYVDLGNVIVDHVDYGASLEPAAYAAAALTSNVGTISSDEILAFKSLAVTNQVQADLTAARVRAQFRLRFSNADSNNDGNSDFAEFTTAEAPSNQPVLVVTYH